MICGRVEWCGEDPRVVRLTDSGVRKVQVVLEDRRGIHRTVVEIEVAEPAMLIQDLRSALKWAREGDPPGRINA